MQLIGLAKGAVTLVLFQCVMYLFPFVNIYLYKSYLSPMEFGTVIYAVSITQLGVVVLEGGVNIAFAKRLTDVGDVSAILYKLSWVVIVIRFFVSFLFCLLLLLVARIGWSSVLVISLIVLCQLSQFQWVYNYEMRFFKLSVLQLSIKTMALLMSWWVLAEGGGVVEVLLAILAANIVGCMVAFFDVGATPYKDNLVRDSIGFFKEGAGVFFGKLPNFVVLYLFVPVSDYFVRREDVGGVGLLDAIMKAVRGVYGVVLQAAYPQFLRFNCVDYMQKGYGFFSRIYSIGLVLMLGFVYLFADILMSTFFEDAYIRVQDWLLMVLALCFVDGLFQKWGYPTYAIVKDFSFVNISGILYGAVFLFAFCLMTALKISYITSYFCAAILSGFLVFWLRKMRFRAIVREKMLV